MVSAAASSCEHFKMPGDMPYAVRANMEAIAGMGCERMRIMGGIPYYRVEADDEFGSLYAGRQDYWTLYSEAQKDLENLVGDMETV